MPCLTCSDIGACSGRDVDKLSALKVRTCAVGWGRDHPPSTDAKQPLSNTREIALADCIAHLSCSVLNYVSVDGHLLLTCKIDRAFVLDCYWTGKTFEPARPDVPPYLSFFGSQRFGVTVPVPMSVSSAIQLDAAADVASAGDLHPTALSKRAQRKLRKAEMLSHAVRAVDTADPNSSHHTT